MILLTRLDKSKVLINLETIKFVESTPDTLITFTNGDTLMVLESMDEVEARVLQYKVRTLKGIEGKSDA